MVLHVAYPTVHVSVQQPILLQVHIGLDYDHSPAGFTMWVPCYFFSLSLSALIALPPFYGCSKGLCADKLYTKVDNSHLRPT